MQSQDILISNVNIAVYALTLDELTKKDILQKYDLLAATKFGSNQSVITNNLDNYSVLLNKTLFMGIVANKQWLALAEFTNLSNLISQLKTEADEGKNINLKLYNTLKDMITSHGGIIADDITEQSVASMLQSFGLSNINENIDDIDLDLDIDAEGEELDIPDLDGLFDEDNNGDEEDSIEEMKFDLDDDAPEQQEAGSESGESTELPEDAVEADKVDNSKKEIIEKLKKSTITGTVKFRVNELIKVLRALYESSFSSFPHVGILGDNGNNASLIKLHKSDDVTKAVTQADSGTSYDYKIMKAITAVLPELGQYAPVEQGETVPNTLELIEKSRVCYQMQLQFQMANIEYSKGRTSIRKWVTETQLKDSGCSNFDEWNKKYNNNKPRLTKFKNVCSWYEWCISNIIYDAIASDIFEYNSSKNDDNQKLKFTKTDDNTWVIPMEYNDRAERIIGGVDSNFRNVIAVSERKRDDNGSLISTEVRISTGKPIDQMTVIQSLENTLNSGAMQSIKVRTRSEKSFEEHNVLILEVIFNKDEADKSDVFAYEVIDSLVEGGGTLSWDHALIGKNEDGTYLYWDDFMNPAKAQPSSRCYTIYAGSRSGKGVMTSTLVVNALCDGKFVFYTDGKPENGVCIGRLAWEQGREAYVFDGQQAGSVPFSGYMENYTFGVRQPSEIADYITKCPSSLFENPKYFNDNKQRMFLGVMRYLKSLYLCSEVIRGRETGQLDKNQWQVWIFDEMTNMSSQEKELRKIFANYVRAKTNKSLSKNPDEAAECAFDFSSKSFSEYIDKNSEKYDEGIDYIYRWDKWTKSIIPNILKAATIGLGKADMNLIFIFQEASWIKTDEKITTIGKVVSMLKSTKIVGRNALSNNLGDYGTATSVNADWYRNKVNVDGAGWWAISKSPDLRANQVQIFKPYKVWTIPLKPGTQELADNPPEGKEAMRYLDAYIKHVASKVGVDPVDVLEQAYEYANSAVNQLGFASNLKEFIYDCSNFAVTEVDASYENLKSVLADDGAPDSNGEVHGMNVTDTVGDSSWVLDDDEPDNRSEIEKQLMQDAQDSLDLQKLSFMSGKKLSSSRLRDSLLLKYFEKYIYKNAKNNNYNYDLRDKSSNKGLYMATIIYSNLHYIASVRKVYDIDEFKQYFYQQITSNVDREHKAKLALGLLQAYDNNELAYDTMPDRSVMIQWMQMFSPHNVARNAEFDNMGMSGNTGASQQGPMSQAGQNPWNQQGDTSAFDDFAIDDSEFDEESMGMSRGMQGSSDQTYTGIYQSPEEEQEVINMYKSPDELDPVDRASFSVERNATHIDPRATQSVLGIQEDQFEETMIPDYSPMQRFRKKLFESKNGTSYEFKKRWDFVLKSAAKLFPNRTMVTRFAISGTSVTVNGKIIGLTGIRNNGYSRVSAVLGGEYDVRLEDIVRIKDTFKKFPMIKEMYLDSAATQQLINEYGSSVQSIWDVFKQNRALQVLGLIPAGATSPVVFNRSTFAQTTDKLEELLNLETVKMNIEQACAEKNPYLHEKSVGYKAKAFASKASSFVDRHPSIRKGAKFSVGAVAAIGLGYFIGWPLMLTGMIGMRAYAKNKNRSNSQPQSQPQNQPQRRQQQNRQYNNRQSRNSRGQGNYRR